MHTSEHHATIDWQRGDTAFDYESYPRDHTWAFPGGITVEASSAPAFFGSPALVDPEEAFVASIAACHMLTFLALASRRGLVVDAYRDSAVGVLEKNDEGRLAITRVTLSPEVRFASDPAQKDVDLLHEQAHRGCFIANSVRTEIVFAE